METKSKLTRSGPRRMGDMYQDLIAMEALVDWLENPEKIESICLEDDEMGSLDDVVTYIGDGTVKLRQVKFSVDPKESEFTWDYLLKQERGAKGPKASLLQKWSKSLFEISSTRPLLEAGVLTNRRPSKEVASCLRGLKVDLALLRESPDFPRIIEQIGDEEQAIRFFEKFEFALSQPSLEGLDVGLRNRFYRLGGSETGWQNLLGQIPIWASKKGAINLEAIKKAALWNRLESLPQDYELPADYVSPSDEFHEDIKNKICNNDSRLFVITGGPGMGKSTYVSYLYKDLYSHDVPVVRHHYFLSVHDRDYSHRLEYQVAAESIMYDINRDYPNSISCISKHNPSPNDLRKWLEESGEYFAQQGKPLIVILDGLDHVWREQRSIEELNNLFRYFWPIPKGIVLLVATQPVDDSKLPQPLLRSAPRDEWIVLRPLDEVSTARWLKFQIKHWPKQDFGNEQYLTLLAQKLVEKSGGHPLYLRYAIRYFLEQNKSLDIPNIDLLPACPHKEITEYYENLWASLSSESKVLLNLIVSSSFTWPKQELINCLDPKPTELAQFQQSLFEINHLLSVGDLGVEPFHNSLSVFISSLPDYKEITAAQKQIVLRWLNGKAPEYWKWGYSWLLEAELGNDNPLCSGTDRTWLVNALAKRRLRHDVQNILDCSFKSLLKRTSLPLAIKVSVLNDYAITAYEFLDEVNLLLLMPQILTESKEDPYFQARLFSSLRDLQNSEIATLAEFAFFSDNQEAIQRCLRELEDRSDRNAKHIDYRDQKDELLIALLKVSALVDKVESIEIINWAIRNRKNIYCKFILFYYSRFLRIFHRISQMRGLLSNGLTMLAEEELDIVLKQAVLLALEENIDLDQIMNSVTNRNNIYIQLYEIFRGQEVGRLEKIALPDAKLYSLSWSEQYDRKDEIKEGVGNLFFGFLCNCLAGKDQENNEWIKTVDNSSWQSRFVHVLLETAKTISSAQATWAISVLCGNLSGLPRPRWNENRDETGYVEIVVDSLPTIMFDLLALYKNRGVKNITVDDIQVISNSEYIVLDSWLQEYLNYQRIILDEPAVRWLIKSQSEYLMPLIAPMADRAKSYALLASISAFHSRFEEVSSFIRYTAENMVGYYFHKDLLLDSVLNVIVSCHKVYLESGRNPAEIGELDKLVKLAPAISEILNFTDGDETSQLPVEFGKALYHIDTTFFLNYFSWLRNSGEYDDELDLLHYYLTNAELNDPLDQAIAGTAVDDLSMSIVIKRVSTEIPSNKEIIEKYQYLGKGTLQQAQILTTDSSSNRNDDKEPPLFDQYPPETFDAFIEELNTRHIIYREEESIIGWVNHWKAIDKEKVYLALVNAIQRSRHIRVADLIFSLSIDLYGPEKSFKWVVFAQKEDYGWSRFYARKERAVSRWKIIQDWYPERWYEFILESFGGGTDTILRLVEYCIFLGQLDLATTVMEKFMEVAHELVSPLVLPAPIWINKKNGK